MKVKYQIIIDQKDFDLLKEDYRKWKAATKHTQESTFAVNLVDEFFNKVEINTVVSAKYNDFEHEVYVRYIGYVKNQIYKILPLAEEKGEWRKHLDTLIIELTGSDKVFLHSINFISLINKLETLKACPEFPNSSSLDEIKNTEEFKVFRKTIFECMNIAENLTNVGKP